jgi:hypothetical protein
MSMWYTVNFMWHSVSSMNHPTGSDEVWPSVASSDYAEVQEKNVPPVRQVQSSDADEVEAGVKVCLLPSFVSTVLAVLHMIGCSSSRALRM